MEYVIKEVTKYNQENTLRMEVFILLTISFVLKSTWPDHAASISITVLFLKNIAILLFQGT